MYTELKTAFVMWDEDPFLGWGGVGWGEVVPYIIGYYFNTYYKTLFSIFSFFFLSIDLIKFFFAG